jgi:hypothetical protein
MTVLGQGIALAGNGDGSESVFREQPLQIGPTGPGDVPCVRVHLDDCDRWQTGGEEIASPGQGSDLEPFDVHHQHRRSDPPVSAKSVKCIDHDLDGARPACKYRIRFAKPAHAIETR